IKAAQAAGDLPVFDGLLHKFCMFFRELNHRRRVLYGSMLVTWSRIVTNAERLTIANLSLFDL
ncbi:MAG: hypothetical protein AAGK74_01085, partial [Chloroflexota bacterium]